MSSHAEPSFRRPQPQQQDHQPQNRGSRNWYNDYQQQPPPPLQQNGSGWRSANSGSGRGGGGGGQPSFAHHNHHQARRQQQHGSNYNYQAHNVQSNGYTPRDLLEKLQESRAQQSSEAEQERLRQLKEDDERQIVAEGAINEQWKTKLNLPPVDSRIKTKDVMGQKQLEFEDFGLQRNLLKGIYEMGWERPSPIQEDSIPVALKGQDILARAKNGTGKTASFCIPLLEKVDAYSNETQAVVLVPTRELALQTSNVLKRVSKHMRISVVVCTGGTKLTEDIMRLMEPVHIIVATPGRLLDLGTRSIANLSKVHTVVLDEADKLLSDSFAECVDDILKLVQPSRQLLLFSATFPQEVRTFKERWMNRQTHFINKMEELTLEGITQYYAFLEEKEKVACIAALFKKLNINQSIIFCSSVKRVELLAQCIVKMGSECLYIHAQMDQDERNEVFHRFREGECRHLVCTDLFTRGIDIQSVNVVINFDFPGTSETYLHRVGRAGRFGHLGIAINLITESDKHDMFRIEKELDCIISPIPQQVDENLYCV